MVDVYIKNKYLTDELAEILQEYTNIEGVYVVDDNDRRNKILQGNVVALIITY